MVSPAEPYAQRATGGRRRTARTGLANRTGLPNRACPASGTGLAGRSAIVGADGIPGWFRRYGRAGTTSAPGRAPHGGRQLRTGHRRLRDSSDGRIHGGDGGWSRPAGEHRPDRTRQSGGGPESGRLSNDRLPVAERAADAGPRVDVEWLVGSGAVGTAGGPVERNERERLDRTRLGILAGLADGRR